MLQWPILHMDFTALLFSSTCISSHFMPSGVFGVHEPGGLCLEGVPSFVDCRKYRPVDRVN